MAFKCPQVACGRAVRPIKSRAWGILLSNSRLNKSKLKDHQAKLGDKMILETLLKQKTDSTLIQLLRYALVGGLAFVVDFASLYFLTEYLGLYYLHSAALAFCLGLTTNYLLSVLWVFQKRTFQNRFVEYTIFALLGVFGLCLNHGLMYFFTEQVHIHYLSSKIFATGLVFLWNFGSRKIILFHFAVADALEPGELNTGEGGRLATILPTGLDSCKPASTQPLPTTTSN
jgi:putative flippase GtrA